jgi:hypothetical protein
MATKKLTASALKPAKGGIKTAVRAGEPAAPLAKGVRDSWPTGR